MRQCLVRNGHIGLVPGLDQFLTLGLAEHAQLAQPFLGVGGDTQQKRLVVLQPPLDRSRVEQVGVVVALDAETVWALDDIEKQVEVQRVLRIAFAHELDARELRGSRIAIDVEEHFDQRRSAQTSRHFQMLKNAADSALVMVVAVQHTLLHGGQIALKGRLGVHLRANW